MCHGDLFLPNVLLDPATCAVTGVIDAGRLGVADRWVDLAIATRSFVSELNPQYGQWATDQYLAGTASRPTRRRSSSTGSSTSSPDRRDHAAWAATGVFRPDVQGLLGTGWRCQ